MFKDRLYHYVAFTRLEVSKLQELGIPAGPLYGKLKKGESVTSPDGLVV